MDSVIRQMTFPILCIECQYCSRSKFHDIQLFSGLIDFEQRMMLWTRRAQACESSVDIGAVRSSMTSNYLLALIDAEQSLMLWSGCAQSGCVGVPPYVMFHNSAQYVLGVYAKELVNRCMMFITELCNSGV